MINAPLTKLLFLDIETVGTEKDFFHFTKNHPRISEFFIKNRSWLDKRYPEHQDSTVEDGKGNFVTKIISGEEKHILTETHSLLNKVQGMGFWICGHNVKSFDIPYIIKRSLMNGIKPSSLLPTPDTKPWEVKAVDTKEFWQLGNYTSLCSLDLMCASMDVESSKDGDVTGNNLHCSYWNTDSQEKINEYCEKDIKVLYQVVKKFYELK
jgi:DNA polymerase elongation subunit (family B)